MPHAVQQPFSCGWHMHQNAVADACEGQAVWLIHPPTHSARIATDLFSEGFEIKVILEKAGAGHCWHGSLLGVTVPINLRTPHAVSF